MAAFPESNTGEQYIFHFVGFRERDAYENEKVLEIKNQSVFSLWRRRTLNNLQD